MHPPLSLSQAPEAMARRFHETYERLAPSFGYVTREDTREFNPDSPNGKLMTAVCAALFPASPDVTDDQIAEIYCATFNSYLDRKRNEPESPPKIFAFARALLAAHPFAAPQGAQPAATPRFQWCCSKGGCGPCDVKRIEFEYSRTETAAGELLESKTSPMLVSACCGAALFMWDNEREQDIEVDIDNVIPQGAQPAADADKANVVSPVPSEDLLSALPGCVKPDTDKQVFFYEQDFYVLSNFSAFSVFWSGLRFDTSEHLYHWLKFSNRPDIQHAVRAARSAHDAFKLAEKHKAERRPDWDAVKVELMRDILRAKVTQHEYVRRKLLATGDRELIEDSWRDDFWGWGPNRDGQNMLGKLWMQVRAGLRAACEARAGARPSDKPEPESAQPAPAQPVPQEVRMLTASERREAYDECGDDESDVEAIQRKFMEVNAGKTIPATVSAPLDQLPDARNMIDAPPHGGCHGCGRRNGSHEFWCPGFGE